MKVTLEVKDRAEREAVQRAWQKPELRAFIVIAGLLDGLPTDRARARVLNYAADKVRDEQEADERIKSL